MYTLVYFFPGQAVDLFAMFMIMVYQLQLNVNITEQIDKSSSAQIPYFMQDYCYCGLKVVIVAESVFCYMYNFLVWLWLDSFIVVD